VVAPLLAAALAGLSGSFAATAGASQPPAQPQVGPTSGTATHFLVSAPSAAMAGTAFSFTVTALDPFNNTATGYGGMVHFDSPDASATLPANSTLSNGVGTFSATLETAGSETISATDTTNASITGTSSSINVSPAAATQFLVSAPSTATARAA